MDIYYSIENDEQREYLMSMNRNAGEGKDIVLFVLSPQLLPQYPLYESFLNVTYRELFNEVRIRIGSHLDKCDNTWFLYMKDFMATVEALC